uniref:protein acetyllysine N-acetyltransferase n=1 Tax=Arcella intermedia TaxID=1963864 RepID=A0A6B2LB65_9EUKA
MREYEDSDADIREYAKQVSDAIKNASHLVVYTGAGVSTSAKIPDYRGPQGAWSVRDYGTQQTGNKKQLDEASPTYTHYALTELAKRGYLKFLISTNLDGLHLRSGFPTDIISEMHGNCYKEICYACDKIYLRSFNVLKTRSDRWTHLTGRFCTECGAELKDTIAHFTENIYKKEYESSEKHARKADIALILGTSMFVQPAASLPYKTLDLEGGKIFLVNLQRTPIDHLCTKIYSETDKLMKLVMQNLGIEVFDTSYDLRDLLEERERALAAEENRKQKWKLISYVALVGVLVGTAGLGYLKYKKSN